MPIAKNGYNEFTKYKHEHLEAILDILAKKFKTIEDYDWVYPNFLDIETHAGEGSYPDPENKTKRVYDSSILRFKTVMTRNEISYESHLFEIRDDARNDLKKQLGTPFDNFYGDFHQLDCNFDDSPTDNYLLTEIIRRIYKAKGKIPFGIIQVDPCGYINKQIQEMFSHNLFKHSSYSNSLLMGMDILFSLNMTAHKRPTHLKTKECHLPHLRDFLQTINKKHWFIRGSVEKDAHQRVLVLGTNWSGFPELPGINMYNINSPMANPIWEKITTTRKELEIKLFYIKNKDLPEVTPIVQNSLLKQEEYLTASDVARRLDRPVHQVIKLINAGELKAHKRKVFWQISEDDLKDFLTREKFAEKKELTKTCEPNPKNNKFLWCPIGKDFGEDFNEESKICQKCNVKTKCEQTTVNYHSTTCTDGPAPDGTLKCPFFGLENFIILPCGLEDFTEICKSCEVYSKCVESFESTFPQYDDREIINKIKLHSKEIKEFKITKKELSEKIGISQSKISKGLALLPYPRLRKDVFKGLVTINYQHNQLMNLKKGNK